MDICFQVVLFQTEKKASIKLVIIYKYIFFVSFIVLFEFQFFLFVFFFFCICLLTMLEYELFNFALNVVFSQYIYYI